MSSHHSLRGIATLLLALVIGCTEPAGPPTVTPVEPRETPWEEQIAAVRARNSDSVRLPGDPVTAEQWAMLGDRCESLEVLEANVTAIPAENFALLAGLPKLRQLILHGPVDDADLQQIAAIPTLQTLNLPAAEFTSAGLSSLSDLPRLELLRFSSPHVTDDGMAIIAKLPALRFLHLINVSITDAGLLPLRDMQQLESFYLDGGDCTDEGLYALLEAHPELHFHRDQLHLPEDPHAHSHEGGE